MRKDWNMLFGFAKGLVKVADNQEAHIERLEKQRLPLCPDCRDQCLEKATKHFQAETKDLQALVQQYQSTEPYDSGKAVGIASVASKLTDALKALEEYGYHTNACPATTEHILEPIETGEKCNCGYAQALGDK
ncbi:hypothetical protein LCGC14_2630530 [marine sediment metagenome]|uniref:Uncharacterized protein n=1 Tax=marine sediment metagenome TaxID=412755 RepID=A0A0F9A0J2_9ZZZZ